MENILRKNNIMYHEKERKIKAIMKDESNNICVDCNKGRPDYISINNACFICRTCFKFHQKFPISISKTIKNNLNSLNLKDLQYLYFGGNKKLLEFMKYEYPKLIKLNPSIAYKTIAMEYYRHWLKYLIEGGNKPHKPDIEIAYKSIDDKDFINKNFLNSNNNDGNVITIDFFNDCYNYNDKNNQTITNFINKKNNNKYKNEYNTNINTNRYINNYNNKRNLMDYYVDINNNKYINTQTIDFFGNTQTNFLPKKGSYADNIIIKNQQTYRKKSTEDILMDSNRKTNALNNSNQKSKMNYNNNDKYYNDNYYNDNYYSNDKSLKPFKTNNHIYVKPKHNILKSLEKSPITVQKNKPFYNENDNNYNNEIETRNDKNDDRDNNMDFIKVKVIKNIKGSKDGKKLQSSSEINIKKPKGKNIIKNKNNYKSNSNIYDNPKEEIINNENLIDKQKKTNDGIKIKKKKKRPNYDSNNIIIEKKVKAESKDKEMKEKINETNNANINDINNANSNAFTNDNDSTIKNNNNIIFKKKNLNDNFNTEFDKNSKMNYSTTQSHFEIINKNKMDGDEIRNFENTDDSLSMTVRTLSTNKSMKQFYSRHPRKMNRTLTKKRKFNDNNKKEKKDIKVKTMTERKMKKLKKEKTEILQSLKILLKMKNELSKREDNQDEEEEEEKEEENEKNESSDKDYEKKDKYKKNNKKNNINVLRKKQFAKIENIIGDNNNEKEKNNEGENEEEEKEKKNKYKKNIKKKVKKKKHVSQSQEFIKKGEEYDSIRTKYKKKQFKYSEV